MNLIPDWLDDKHLIIFAATAIAIYAIYAYPGTESKDVVMSITTGLFGIAVGRSTK